MKVKPTICAILIFAGQAAAAESGFDLDHTRLKDLGRLPEMSARPALPAAKRAEKEWTVMVFMNAKNNLSEFALQDVNEMESADSAANLNVVVELGLMEGTKRYKIERDFNYGVITSPVLIRDANADMGDFRRVAEFVGWSRRNYPAKRYMLILWNHGLGWLDPQTKGISFDDETGNYITTPQLAEMFAKTGKLDVFATNACLMQMVETAYQARGFVDVISGSEDFMFGSGYDYLSLLTRINKNAAAPTEKIGEQFVESYYKSNYSTPYAFFAYSSIRVSELGPLADDLAVWARAVRSAGEEKAVLKAISGAVRFGISGKDPKKELTPYTDLYDFVKILSLNSSAPEVKKLGWAVLDRIKNRVVIKKWGSGFDGVGYDYSNTHGISVQTASKGAVPANFYDQFITKYDDLPFARDSGWGQLVKWLETVKGSAR